MANGFKIPKLPKATVKLPKNGTHISANGNAGALKALTHEIKMSQGKPSGRAPAGPKQTFSGHPGHGNASKTAQQVTNELEAKNKGMASQLAPY